ncbi:hypothetical protein BDV98DRAFT_593390 [Pterulicium gracile]|uniref:Uncharacterized protein n=1 Tax=Pterulicium gracile TaxID=1884261 RepID=A0A5C3QI49_9AGAR|nr:hypothetical protein BDV98DRAFT_593390 [Pterula gracilis]
MPGTSHPSVRRPLCLHSFCNAFTVIREFGVQGKHRTGGYIGRVPRLLADYPAFANTAVEWMLSHSSDESVRSTVDKLLPCHCNKLRGLWIKFLHWEASATAENAIKSVAHTLCVLINAMLLDINERRLAKVNDLQALGRKHKQYEAISRFCIDEPRTLVRSACSWWKIWFCEQSVLLLATYAKLKNSKVEDTITEMEPDVPVLALQRIAELIKDPQSETAAVSAAEARTLVNMPILAS